MAIRDLDPQPRFGLVEAVPAALPARSTMRKSWNLARKGGE
jgi:hypothetical protein